MHMPIPYGIWAMVAQYASGYKLQLASGWGEFDQLIYPGQQYITVGWELSWDAPRLHMYVGSGRKYTDAPEGALCIQRQGDWSEEGVGTELEEAIHGLRLLEAELLEEGAYQLNPVS